MTDRSNLQCKMTSLVSDSTVIFMQGHNFFKQNPHFRHFRTYKNKSYSALPQLSTKTNKGVVNGPSQNMGLAKKFVLFNTSGSITSITFSSDLCLAVSNFFTKLSQSLNLFGREG